MLLYQQGAASTRRGDIMSAVRSIGSGVVTFGLVSVPVKLYTATSDERVPFHMLHQACGSQVKMPLTCDKCERKIERHEVVKGYETTPGEHVIFTGPDMDALESAADPCMEIMEFVSAGDIDPVYFASATYLGPNKGGEKAYSLLTHVLQVTGMVAIAQRVFRGKEQLIAIRALPTGLVLHVLYYADEVRSMSDAVGPLASATDEEAVLATKLIGKMRSKFQPEKYKDGFRGRVEAVVKAKQDGQEVVSTSVTPRAPAPNIMDALRASLAADHTTCCDTHEPTVVKKAPAKHASKEAQL
jgi:DNA end-binding protein Ku